MTIHKILVVDDEPYIVDCVSATLSLEFSMNLEVLRAYSAAAALEIMRRERVDVLVTDIKMPGMTGLELLRAIREKWSECKAVILTAHAEFDYVTRAMDLGVVKYVLKTDHESVILAAVRQAICEREAALEQSARRAVSQAPERDIVRRSLFLDLLSNAHDYSEAEASEVLARLGLARENLRLIVCAGAGRQTRAVKLVMSHYLTSALSACACEETQTEIIWLLNGEERGEVIAERVETACESVSRATDATLAFAISRPIAQPLDISRVFRRAADFLARTPRESGLVCVMPTRENDVGGEIAERVSRYVDAHVGQNVSLGELSAAIGYSASYLSTLFREKTGQNLSEYIAEKRMTRVKALMRDDSLTLEEIAVRAGFDSRSYFNRFVKRMTSLSPQKFRLSVK